MALPQTFPYRISTMQSFKSYFDLCFDKQLLLSTLRGLQNVLAATKEVHHQQLGSILASLKVILASWFPLKNKFLLFLLHLSINKTKETTECLAL